MSQAKPLWAVLATCLLYQTIIVQVACAPPKEKQKTEVLERQSPLTPSQFSLAATRFIVLLPFLPLLMMVPGMTGILMPMFMALQDRLTTIAPNFNLFGIRPNNNNNNNNQASSGSVSNQGITVSTSTEAPSSTTVAIPTYYRFKRGILKSPTKTLNEGFREVFDVLSKADDALNLLTATEPDCRRQAVCRLHQSVDPSIGAFLGNLIEVFKLESRIEKLDVTDFTKTILKDLLQAANIGLYHQDCSSVFHRCKVTLKSIRSIFS